MRPFQIVCILFSTGALLPVVAFAQTASPVSEADRKYLVQNAQSSAYELALAKLAQTMATRPDIKNFASTIIADHPEMDSAIDYVADVRDVKLIKQPSKDEIETLAALQKLSGSAFDKQLLEDITEIDQAQSEANEFEMHATKDSGLKSFIHRQITLQAQHSEMAEILEQP